MVSVTVQSRSGRELATIELDGKATVGDLKCKFHAAKSKFYPSRQRLTLPPASGEQRGKALPGDAVPLTECGVVDGSVVVFKDLGPQISWSTVFFWEYFGPLALYPLFYFFPDILYPSSVTSRSTGEHAPVQTLALAYWSFHYVKRILETYLVHKFGHATMPIFNLFKNCSYYWGFAAFVSYFVNHPLYTPPPLPRSELALLAAFGCQVANLYCHLLLAGLRKPGESGYKIPRGFLFNYITCANYTAEICGWVLFTVATQTVAAGLFTAAGAYQMILWAVGKHRRLVKIFNGKDGMPKYPRRWIILPPFL